MTTTFQRARSDAQKAERIQALIEAARELLQASMDSSSLSLNELARRAGMSKSNVYRYFESREAILLAVLSDGARAWEEGVRDRMAAVDPAAPLDQRLAEMAQGFATESAARPLYGHLLSVLPGVLERNASADTVRDFKLRSRATFAGLAEAMHTAVPELSVEQAATLLHHVFPLLVGLWPLAHPSPAVLEATDHPELVAMRHDFVADLSRSLQWMARGLLAS